MDISKQVRMFATFKAKFYTDRQKSLPLHCVARAFFMHVTYLLYMAGSTVRAYIVMVYASLSVLSFEQRLVDTRHSCIHTNVQ